MTISSSWFGPQRVFLFCVFFSPLFVWPCVVYSQPSSTSTVGPDIPGIIVLYNVLYTWRIFIHKECCCCWCSVRCYAAAVRHRVPDGWKKMLVVRWIWVHPAFSFLSFKHDIFVMYVPLGSTIINTSYQKLPFASIVAFSALICLYYILGNNRHARSQGGRQRRSPFCTYVSWWTEGVVTTYI